MGNELCLHEQIRESGVGLVRGLGSQHDLGIGREIDLTVSALEIGHRQSTKLGVVLGRNHDLEDDRERPVPLRDLGAVLRIDDVVLVRGGSGRLEASGPHATGPHIPQEDERPPAVSGRVLAPAGHGKLAPSTEPGARRRDHDRVAPVGEKMGAGGEIVRGVETSQGGRNEVSHERGDPNLLGPWPGDGHRTRSALLEQKLGCLDHRMRIKTLPDQPVAQHVPQRDESHPLVMRHVGADHDRAGFLRQPRGCVIERFVEPVSSPRSSLLEADEVCQGGSGVDHGRERGSVRSHHHVLEQPALEPQAGYAKRGVLIRELRVAYVVGRFGDSPWDPPLRAVADLAPDHETAREIQQALRGLRHHEKRHEVLEHGPGPRDQGRAVADRRERSAEMEPVLGRHIALGDGKKARQPGLGGQQVVPAGIERAVGHAIADGEELARWIEQELEVHGLDHLFGERGGGGKAVRENPLVELHVTGVAADGVPDGARPDQDLGSGVTLDLARKRVRDVQQVVRSRLELADVEELLRQRRREILQRSYDRLRGLAQLRRRDRLRTAGILGFCHRIDQEFQSVRDPLEHLRACNRTLRVIAARLNQCEQIPPKVAAVHGRYVHGFERPEVLGVVPVEKVAMDATQAAHGPQRSFEPFHGFQGPDPAQVAGDDRAQQIESQVRRRGAAGLERLGIFLEVVRREAVVTPVYERLEETPGPAGDQPQGARLLGGESLGRHDLRGDADPPGENG
jgi:hypothetical protein